MARRADSLIKDKELRQLAMYAEELGRNAKKAADRKATELHKNINNNNIPNSISKLEAFEKYRKMYDLLNNCIAEINKIV